MPEPVTESREVPLEALGGNAVAKRKIIVANGVSLEVLVFRNQSGDICAYQNICPHLGAPLDAGTGKFFDKSGEFLMCKFHQAMFEPSSGLCTFGPCEGHSLKAVPTRIEDGVVLIG
ncbi:MAG: Rieske (2Fe-2S) protein [Sphingomonadaceae bacterium]|nr:Rieske (2Fe-2S) protein [Sphingomonadaceae bacterium]